MLRLDPTEILASGSQRFIYRHPHEPNKLIKLLRPEPEKALRSKFGNFMEASFPWVRTRWIRKEYLEYLRFMLLHKDCHVDPPIAHMFGFVKTVHGLGCISEVVSTKDGRLGSTLIELLEKNLFTTYHLLLLNDTISRIYNHDIRASDMSPKNFVFGHRINGNSLGPEECVLVDGFGDIHAIPVRSMAKWSNRLGLDDSCKRISRSTGLLWDKKTRQFALP